MTDAITATNRHYDLPPEVFATFLGQQMKYTCGLYQTGSESLEEAQDAKLEFISGLLDIPAGGRVLDVGCGWGSLTLFLAARGVQVTGITPSGVQSDYLRRRAHQAGLSRLVDIQQVPIEEFTPEGRYTGVALVGSIEHMPDAPAVMAIVASLLQPDGRLYMSASCYRDRESFDRFADRPASRQVTEEVFGFGTLRPLSTLVEAVEGAGLSVTSITDLTADYRRTVDEWMRGAERHRVDIDRIEDGLSERLLTYMATTNAGWGYTTKHMALTAARTRMGRTAVFAAGNASVIR